MLLKQVFSKWPLLKGQERNWETPRQPQSSSQEPQMGRDKILAALGSHPAPDPSEELLALLPALEGKSGAFGAGEETQQSRDTMSAHGIYWERKIRFSTKMELPKPLLQAKVSKCFISVLWEVNTQSGRGVSWQQGGAERFDGLRDIRFERRLQSCVWNTETGSCMSAHIQSTKIK